MIIYIGYDSSQHEAYEVCKASIERYTHRHEIRPLVKQELERKGYYWRPYQNESTEFAFTRFLVPYLSMYQGCALFCDSDFMWKCDPQEIVEVTGTDHPVYCVKHPQFLVPDIKMNNKLNLAYPKKYWSSLMWFNNIDCQTLNLEYINHAPAGALHEMEWAESVGDIPAEYNAMVNYYDFKSPKAVHFTDGGPWHNIHDNILYSNEWKQIYKKLQKEKD